MIVAIVVASTVVHCETVNVGDGACMRGGEDRCGVFFYLKIIRYNIIHIICIAFI